MKEKNLLASVALFSDLYNNKKYKGVSDVIAEYIKGVVIYENRYCLTSTEITTLLDNVFEFKIPESVVRTTLRHKFSSSAEKRNGFYYFNNDITNGFEDLNKDYIKIIEIQNQIFSDLIQFVQNEEKKILNKEETYLVFENLNKYLLDNGVSDKYSKYISAFVIKNQNNSDFIDSLNSIKEGVILYQGIKYTADINELGKWTSELTIFINTELLFSALGYNGTLFEDIFNDFYKLVKEINSTSLNQNQKKVIELKYFEETKLEVDNFFLTAESIINGYTKLDPFKTAMKKIVSECKTPSDVKTLCVKFYGDLRKMGITSYVYNLDVNDLGKFNLEDENLLIELKTQSEKIKREFNEDECIRYLKIFTKINSLRKGHSNSSLENIGYILMTENSFVKYLAHNYKVKFYNEDIPFAKDIDFITNKFWFKLKKGFSDKNNLPKSFNVVTKAKLIIASQLNNTISHEYQKLVKESKDGHLTNEEAHERSYALREKPNKPEDISIENIDTSMEFLHSDDYLEDFYREKEKKEAIFRETSKKNEELLLELQRRDELDRNREIEERRKQLESEKADYIIEEWSKLKKMNNRNFLFILTVFLLNFILVFSPILLKVNKLINDWIISIGNFQYLLWIPYAVIITIEILGRSYLFNKDKIKNGWLWFTMIFSKKEYFNYRETKKQLFIEEFNLKNQN